MINLLQISNFIYKHFGFICAHASAIVYFLVCIFVSAFDLQVIILVIMLQIEFHFNISSRSRIYLNSPILILTSRVCGRLVSRRLLQPCPVLFTLEHFLIAGSPNRRLVHKEPISLLFNHVVFKKIGHVCSPSLGYFVWIKG